MLDWLTNHKDLLLYISSVLFGGGGVVWNVINLMKGNTEEKKKREVKKKVKNLLKKARKLRRGNKEKAIDIYEDILKLIEECKVKTKLIDLTDLDEYFAQALIEQGKLFYENSRSLNAFGKVISSFAKSGSEILRVYVAEAYVYMGIKQDSQYYRDIIHYNDIIKEFMEDKNPLIILWVTRAYLNRGLCNDYDNDYDKVIEKENSFTCLKRILWRRISKKLSVLSAMAVCNKHLLILKNEQESEYENVIKESDDLIRRFEKTKEFLTRFDINNLCNWRGEAVSYESEIVARALCNKGEVLKRLNRFDEAVKTYTEKPCDRFLFLDVIHSGVADALLKKGNHFSESGDWEKAIKTYEDVIKKFSSNRSAAIAEALYYQGNAYSQINRWEKACEVYKRCEELKKSFVSDYLLWAESENNIIHSFCKDEESDQVIREKLVQERKKNAQEMIEKCKESNKSHNQLYGGCLVDGDSDYKRVIERFRYDPDLDEQIAEAFFLLCNFPANLRVSIDDRERENRVRKYFKNFIRRFRNAEQIEIKKMIVETMTNYIKYKGFKSYVPDCIDILGKIEDSDFRKSTIEELNIKNCFNTDICKLFISTFEGDSTLQKYVNECRDLLCKG